MKRQTSQWMILACMALLVLTVLTGCARRDAQRAIEAAQEAQQEAQMQLAPKYARQQYTDASSLLDMARRQFDAGDYALAQETSQQAQSRFFSARDAVPEIRQRVEAALDVIEEALLEAETNIQEARSQGEATPEQINPIASAVEDLRSRFDVEVRQDYVDQADLDRFLREVREIIPETESLAVIHLRPTAMDFKAVVDDLMEQARNLRAETHEPELYQQVSSLYIQLESAELEGDWQRMIDLSEQIQGPLDQMIASAQRMAARDIIDDLEREVGSAKALGFGNVQAFANSLAQAEDALEVANDQLDAEAYAGAIAAADEARSQLQAAFGALGQEAETLLTQAEASLQQALELDIEQYAPAVLSQVRANITQSRQMIGAERYPEAYTAALRAREASDRAPSAARRGRAQAVLNQAERPFAQLQQQGGAQYAREEFEEARIAIRRLRDMLEAGQFEALEEGVPEAVQLVQTGLRALETASASYVREAEDALELAREAGAPEWMGMQYANAVNLRASAQQALENGQFLGAVERSEEAIQTARQAESRAYQIQTDQNLRRSEELLAEARRANQDTLQPLAYRQAMDARSQALSRLQTGDHRAAFHLSEEALELSDRAMNAMVIAARNAADSAVSAGAMDYARPEIQQALVLLNQTEDAQATRNYEAANQLSSQVQEIAGRAEHFTWQQRSHKLLRDMEGVEQTLEAQLAAEKTPSLYRRVVTSMARARVHQIDGDHKNAFQYADEARNAQIAIYDSMRADLTRTKMELRRAADWLGENAEDARGRNIKMSLMDRIEEVDRMMNLHRWRDAYRASGIALREADQATSRLQRHNRYEYARELKALLASYEEQNALNITPDQKVQFEEAIHTLRHPARDTTYADLLTIYEEALDEIDRLPESIDEQALQRTEEVAIALQQIVEAGGRRYFPDDMRNLTSELQLLRNAIQGNEYKEIAHRLRKLERDVPALLSAVELANAEDQYLEQLEVLLVQASNLTLDFEEVTKHTQRIYIAARATEYKIDDTANDVWTNMQTTITARSFHVNAQLLEERVNELNPPHTLRNIQRKAEQSFALLRRAGHGFERFGRSDTYDLHNRNESLKRAFDDLRKAILINSDLDFAINDARNLTKWEKFTRNIGRLESRFMDSFYSWEYNK